MRVCLCTEEAVPRRLGPKRATRIRKLFALDKADKMEKQYRLKREVSRGEGKKPTIKAPKIQRLVTPQRLQVRVSLAPFPLLASTLCVSCVVAAFLCSLGLGGWKCGPWQVVGSCGQMVHTAGRAWYAGGCTLEAWLASFYSLCLSLSILPFSLLLAAVLPSPLSLYHSSECFRTNTSSERE